jgi:hypothetical protein
MRAAQETSKKWAAEATQNYFAFSRRPYLVIVVGGCHHERCTLSYVFLLIWVEGMVHGRGRQVRTHSTSTTVVVVLTNQCCR